MSHYDRNRQVLGNLIDGDAKIFRFPDSDTPPKYNGTCGSMSRNEESFARPVDTETVSWRIEANRRLVIIYVGAELTDHDLTKCLPKLWNENPDVIWYNAVVIHKDPNSTSNWSWNGLLTAAQDWQEYAQGRNPEKRVAIVTTNYWITQLVNKALGLIFTGNVMKSFDNLSDALEWAEAGPSPIID